MVSFSFVMWQGAGVDKEGRFVINYSRQSKHWARGMVKMETLQGFTVGLENRDMLMPWDFKSGYRHLYLHPDVRD